MTKDQAIEKMAELSIEFDKLKKIIDKKEYSKDITQRVKSYEDACKILNIDPQELLPYSKPLDAHGRAINAVTKLIIIAKALNEEWEPDWENNNEYKWYPWFRMQSGFAFSFTFYVFSYTRTHVGSRLCFKTETLAEYAGKNFESIYKEWLT